MTTTHLIAFLIALTAATPAWAQMVKKTEGKAASSNLKVKKSGVVQYEMYNKKTKAVPRLNIGEEPAWSASSPTAIALPAAKTLQAAAVKVPPRVAGIVIKKELMTAVKPAPSAKTLSSPEKVAKIAPVKELAEIRAPSLKEPVLSQIEIKDLTPGELKLLQALIFLEIQSNPSMAFGLLADLQNDGPALKTDATYQLGIASRGVGLESEYRHQMMKVLDEKSTDWQKRAARQLAEYPLGGDSALVPILDPKLEKFDINVEKSSLYQLNRAKYYQGHENLRDTLEAIENIQPENKEYAEAQFFKGVVLYRAGLIKEAREVLTTALKNLEENHPDSELKTVAALTLARMQFQVGDYKASYQAYLKVDKKHPEWPQAIIEQAWAQILSGDYEGAAGNMFSLHTDFFKNTFAPESYVVRTVGYLNLCQYGDGARVVQELKYRYTPVQAKMDAYSKSHKKDLDHYETVRSFLKNADAKEIDGLPRGFIWALARHPQFMAEQGQINHLEEQIQAYGKVTMDLLKREKFLLSEQDVARDRIANEKKKLKPGESSEAIANLEKRMRSFKLQHQIVKDARTAIKDIREAGISRIEKEKAQRKVAASKALASRFKGMLTSLSNSLDQIDVLQYELYSGAGEHLRYQAAGGKIKPSQNEGLKPQADKQLNWEFKGEVWEDELGHYRSSLKNVCPQVEGGT